jgi:tetratricopeptide (TPR) repeat protein
MPVSKIGVAKVRKVPRVLSIFVAAVLIAGCATRSVAPRAVVDVARADKLTSAGCYACLTEALAIYERALQSTRRPTPGLVQAAFETALFVALREKELGIPAAAAIEKARGLAAPSQLVLTQLVDLAPAESAGDDPDIVAARNSRERRALVTELRPALEAAQPQTLLISYLKTAFDCDDPKTRPHINAKELLARHGNALVLRWRLALCALGARESFQEIRDADARWIETTFFLGRRAATSRPPNLRGAIDFFNLAVPAFPNSPAILLALAHAERGYGDLEPALATYDKVLTMVPSNREALLGRVITLSYLDRNAEAIETATKMIDLGTWLLGDAYYWRARNRYILKALDDAWSDAEFAVKLAANTNVYTLAGVIAYERKELDTAKDRFDQARKLDRENCTAQSYFALVHAAQNNWPEATPVFSIAMACFARASAQASRELAEIEAADFDPVFRGRLAAEHRKTIKESDLKGAQAAYNAAQGFLRGGQRPEAIAHLQLALQHPELQTQAETLKKLIER